MKNKEAKNLTWFDSDPQNVNHSPATSQDVGGCHIYSSMGHEQLVPSWTPPESLNDRILRSLQILGRCSCAPSWSSTLTSSEDVGDVHTTIFTDGLLLSVCGCRWDHRHLSLNACDLAAPRAQKNYCCFPFTNTQKGWKQPFPSPSTWTQRVRAESPLCVGLRETHFNHLACFQSKPKAFLPDRKRSGPTSPDITQWLDSAGSCDPLGRAAVSNLNWGSFQGTHYIWLTVAISARRLSEAAFRVQWATALFGLLFKPCGLFTFQALLSWKQKLTTSRKQLQYGHTERVYTCERRTPDLANSMEKKEKWETKRYPNVDL